MSSVYFHPYVWFCWKRISQTNWLPCTSALCASLRNHGLSPLWWGPVCNWILCVKTGRIGMLCGYKSILVEVTTSKVSPEKYRLALLFGVLKASKVYCWGQGTWARGILADIWCTVWSWLASWLEHGDSLLMNWVRLLVEFSGFETKYNPGDAVELKILDCSRTTSQRQEGKHISRHVLSPKDQETRPCHIGYPKAPASSRTQLPRTLENCTQVHLPITGQGPSSPSHCQTLDTMSQLPNPTPNGIMGKGCHVFYQSQTMACPGMAPVPVLQLLGWYWLLEGSGRLWVFLWTPSTL